MRHVVVAWAYNFPLSSSMRPSTVAPLLPSESTAPSQRTPPVFFIRGRRKLTFSSSVVWPTHAGSLKCPRCNRHFCLAHISQLEAPAGGISLQPCLVMESESGCRHTSPLVGLYWLVALCLFSVSAIYSKSYDRRLCICLFKQSPNYLRQCATLKPFPPPSL